MARSIRVEVRWNRAAKMWKYKSPYIPRGHWQWYGTKAGAIRAASGSCNNAWIVDGQPCILLIYTKSNRIAKGRNGEHSYGCDSRRRRG